MQSDFVIIIARALTWSGDLVSGIGIPAHGILVRYRSVPVSDWVIFFQYQTIPDIGIFIHSGKTVILKG
jgi:hypothetical protein